MLKSLYIRNFAIVDETLVSFESGFNVITGETGVGKSLLIDALNVALGERAYKDLIREGADGAVVEATFDLENDRTFLDRHGISGSAVVLKREIRQQGSSRVWINGRSASVQELKTLGDLLVDLHGQHEHQYLLNEGHHLLFLDDFAQTTDLRQRVGEAYADLVRLETRLKNLEADKRQRDEQRQLYAFQLEELQDVDPQPDELETLERELKLLDNAQQIVDLAAELQALSLGDQGVVGRIQRMNQVLEGLSEYTTDAGEFLPELSAARVTLQEIGEFAQSFSAAVDADPQRLERTRNRIHQLNRLCQKYNRTYPELLDYLATIREQLQHDQPVEVERRELEKAIDAARLAYSTACVQLSKTRQREATLLTAAILEKLKRLGIPQARFEIQVEQVPDPQGSARHADQRFKADATGMDMVAFWMQANPGEPLRPLARIASGGEISRVMLALKSSLSGRDRVSTVIFDEIDTGISGKIARVVGHELQSLGTHHQLISITHLPQIASLADTHYRVEKLVKDHRTVTRVSRLDMDGRLEEIAKLLGDGEVTPTSLAAARELMNTDEKEST